MKIPPLSKGGNIRMDQIALAILIIGGLNWGSIGIFGFDVIGWIFGGQLTMGSRIVFVIVALAALWCIRLLFHDHDEEPVHRSSGEVKNGM